MGGKIPTCSSCGSKLLPSAKFCIQCGEPTRHATVKRRRGIFCQNCGAKLFARAQFCGRCGAKVVTAPAVWFTYLASLLGGIIVIIPAALVEFLVSLGISNASVLVIAAGFVEEPLKQVGVARMAFKKPSGISSRKMGLIAGALAGLGFGLIESIFYTAILSGIIPLPEAIGLRTMTIFLHMAWSAMAGLGIFYATKKGGKLKFLLLLIAAICMHAAWNYVALKFG